MRIGEDYQRKLSTSMKTAAEEEYLQCGKLGEGAEEAGEVAGQDVLSQAHLQGRWHQAARHADPATSHAAQLE